MNNRIKVIKLLCLLLIFLNPVSLKAETTEIEKVENAEITVITPYLEETIHKDKNLVYCGTFQLAWNVLQDNIYKGPLELEKNKEFATYMNRQLFNEDYISDDSHVTDADYLTQDFVDKLNNELKTKFGSDAPVVSERPVKDLSILSYSYLYKNIQFNIKFDSFNSPFYFKDSKVKSFGISKNLKTDSMSFLESLMSNKEGLREQVYVLDYQNNSDFIIELETKNGKDNIVLAKIKPESTLLKTIDVVKNRISTKIHNIEDMYLKNDEVLKIPEIKFDIEHSYSDIIGDTILNNGKKEKIEKAVQHIKFQLDENGVALESEAKITVYKSMSRSFIFDSPFLIYLEEKEAKYPYLALWIGNSDLLVKY
ncbi:MAG: hypothetical protein ACOCRU_01230 [bacterium]